MRILIIIKTSHTHQWTQNTPNESERSVIIIIIAMDYVDRFFSIFEATFVRSFVVCFSSRSVGTATRNLFDWFWIQ